MLHPSYTDLMKVVNSEVEIGEEPVVNSRYSIVIATSKRARQLIAGSQPMSKAKCNKPFSIAVEELYTGNVKILADEEGMIDEDMIVLDTSTMVETSGFLVEEESFEE